ncbi:MAG: complex I subunit 5 family protein, partial [Oscillospiraceae bacterium]|nr:complex I subunit 5 family protein [Oscillospiraceae bacterium]
MTGYWLLLPILLPALFAALTFLAENRKFFRLSLIALWTAELLLTLSLGLGCAAPVTLLRVTDALRFTLATDHLSVLFGVLVTCCWFGAGVFAFRYLEHVPHPKRFFAFYQLTLSALLIICFSGNLPTLYLGYEAMTLLSLPLVFHAGSKAALNAGVKYLGFSVLGAGLGLFCMLGLQGFCPTTDFVPGGVIASCAGNQTMLCALYLIGCIGFGCKAGMFPLHAWLPTAHPVAPAPASAVLSGVITKMGVFAILRVTFYVFGVELLSGSWAQLTLVALSLATVFMG